MLTIYGKQQCPYCVMSKACCDENGIEYAYHSLDDTPELRDIIIAAGMRTVPCIFEGSTLIGGYDDLVDWHQSEDIFD